MHCEEIQKTEEHWTSWKTVAGYAYIIICIFDFLIMPVAVHANKIDTRSEINAIIKEHGIVAGLEIIEKIQGDNHWIPVTMSGGGLFHISFGAILTGAAVTRGFERREIVKNGNSRRNSSND